MRTVAVAAVALLSACLTGCLQKGVDRRAPAFSSVWNLTVGYGAEYEVNGSTVGKSVLGLAVIADQRVKGKTGFWIQVSSRLPKSSWAFLNSALLYRTGNTAVIVQGIMQVPGHPPMRVPGYWMFTWTRGILAQISGYITPYGGGGYGPMPAGSPPGTNGPVYSGSQMGFLGAWPSDLPEARAIGHEILSTPAGTFRCQHWRFKAVPAPWINIPQPVDVWVAKGAGPFGIVRAQLADPATEMLLTQVTHGAKNEITGSPRPARQDELWYWLWQERQRLLQLRLPQLGLPVPSLE